MSGVAGLFRRSGERATAAELAGMTDAIAHRGPDGHGRWRDGPVGLGHHRLQTTPAAHCATLPLSGNGGSHVLTMDARIDNRATVCDALGITGASTVTDGQLLLAAYEKWGTACFARIVGAFAVVIHDRTDQRVVCARDHMGIKPLYYALTDDLFAFGSEPKALLASSSVPATVDDESVVAFLTDSFEDSTATFFEAVRRLPPGTVMVVEPETVRTRSYWRPDPTAELELPSDAAYERRFRDRFTEAVRCRLRTPTPTHASVAAYLSGGLDSTAVACTAQNLLASGESLQTLSVTHSGYPAADETSYLDAVRDAYPFETHVLEKGGASPFPALDRRLRRHDAPFYPPLFTVDQWFAEAFREPDRRVVLHGIGGDQTLYYGTAYLPELLADGRLARLWTELTALADVRGRSRRDLFAEAVGGAFAPEPLRRLWRWYGSDPPSTEPPTILRDEYRTGRDASAQRRHATPPRHHREEHWRHVVDPQQVFFLEVIDAELAGFGVEPRYPYFDPRLVAFCLALPATQKMRHGVGRHVLRRALRDTVPAAVRTRTDKANFIPSWVDGLYREDRHRLRERLVQSPEWLPRYVDAESLHRVYRRFTDSPSYETAWPLTKAYALETWLRRNAPDSE